MNSELTQLADMQNIMWVLLCTSSVLLMQAGFCFLEAGSVRSKNSINVAIKNFSDFCIASVVFWVAGFAIMYSPVLRLDTLGYFFFSIIDSPSLAAFFVFQVVFCGTAATIMSGAIAERASFMGYLITTFFVSLLAYPVFGRWAWNGTFEGVTNGWLNQQGFIDFAGCSVVHSVGGWVSLAAILIIGPRIGRFGKDCVPIQGHSIPMATVGTIILWFGWLGFNGGSNLAMNGSVPVIILNTNLSAAFGGLTMLLVSWVLLKKPDVTHILNGALAGLVSVTASCNSVLPYQAAIIGILGGCIYYIASEILVRLEIDDVVNAVPVHGMCGLWGTLCVALFGDPEILGTGLDFQEQLLIQIKGIVVCFVWAFGGAYLFLAIVNRFVPLRVKRMDEIKGLNVAEHGASTEVLDLLNSMTVHKNKGDFSEHVFEEPHTEIGQIAKEYNNVLEKVNKEINITAHKNQQLAESHERLIQTQTQLVESEKMSSLSGLVAGIAHEINTPVGIGVTAASHLEDITSRFSDLYQSGNLSRKDFENYIDNAREISLMILSNLKRAADLIQSFKQIAVDQSSEEQRRFQMNEYIHEILSSMHPQFKKTQHTIRVNCPEEFEVNSFPGALSQIIANLLMNSLLHGFEGIDNGTITIDIRKVDDQVKLSYKDSGCGIPVDNLNKIFDPFFTTKRGQGGSGLGMHIVYNLVTQTLGGSIGCDSVLNEGTRFDLEFPGNCKI
jgi:Amt family ammonium transporter